MDSPPGLTSAKSKISDQNSSPVCSVGKLKEIFTWKNPTASGIIYGIINLTFLIFWFSGLSLISAISLLGLFAMLIGYISSVLLHTASSEVKTELVSKSSMENFAVCAYDALNTLGTDCRAIMLWKDKTFSFKITAVLAVLSYVASFLSFGCSLFLGINLLFYMQYISTFYKHHLSKHIHKMMSIVESQMHRIPQIKSAHYTKKTQ